MADIWDEARYHFAEIFYTAFTRADLWRNIIWGGSFAHAAHLWE